MAANISILLLLEKVPKSAEKRMVNPAMIASLLPIAGTKYKMTIDMTGRSDAAIVPMMPPTLAIVSSE